jgi:hypothetical protein
LLDPHLKNLIPPLVAAYLDSLRSTFKATSKKGFIPLSHAVCQLLNLFCKVRGEKVIKGLLNNEPRYLEPILSEFETGKNFVSEDGEPLPQSIVPWTERYILLLWLSHLALAPFPLASISAVQSSREVSTALEIDLPTELPEITLRILTICIKGLLSATKERGAAANLLVRLCVRPDMQKLGLLEALVKWSLSYFSKVSEGQTEIHQCLGVMSFQAGLVASATNEEMGPFLPAIYQSCQNILGQSTLSFIKASAVARKLVVKTLRNIVIHCLQANADVAGLDTTAVTEETIEFLLETLADGDSPVRYAASKALSIVTMKLESEMGGDVIEAILGSLNENVWWQGTKRNLSGVNPLLWHGLTLTLSHLLYRRAVSTAQLPDILNALLLALAFEQRSATGGSIGTNVRDAACFGIWALSRRYTTNELLAVETSTVRASEHYKSLSVPQVLAIELLVAACLDPAGNIRRGSSAALQELIGRHPNTIEEGIPLVQIVDFHAVGLRERAMSQVAVKAGQLRQVYWEALFENILGWRGTGSLDAPSRLYAASAVGLMSAKQTPSVLTRMASEISSRLKALKAREIEERQGLICALSAFVDETTSSKHTADGLEVNATDTPSRPNFMHLWSLFEDVLDLEEKSFTSPALRPELTASSMCKLLGALAHMTTTMAAQVFDAKIPSAEIVRLLNLCLGRHEDSVLEAIPRTANSIVELLSKSSPIDKDDMVSGWLTRLENEASYNGLRCSGFAIALGAVYTLLNGLDPDNRDAPIIREQTRIVQTLTFRCTSAVAIEARTVALKALGVLLAKFDGALPQGVADQISNALHIALNDYTTTERGDVGSLVRLEALSTIGTAWNSGLINGSKLQDQLHADVLRLSLEKLDKIRTRAAHTLEQASLEQFEHAASGAADGVSSYAYFANALTIFQPSTPSIIKEAICFGFITSAGMGSESVVQNSRAALLDAIGKLPTTATEGQEQFTLLEIVSCFVDILKKSLDNERVLLPLLEIIAFLFDMQVMQRLIPTSFR